MSRGSSVFSSAFSLLTLMRRKPTSQQETRKPTDETEAFPFGADVFMMRMAFSLSYSKTLPKPCHQWDGRSGTTCAGVSGEARRLFARRIPSQATKAITAHGGQRRGMETTIGARPCRSTRRNRRKTWRVNWHSDSNYEKRE